MCKTLFGFGIGMLVLRAALNSVSGCSCLPPPPPLSAAEAADAVFVGRVISVESTHPEERFAPLEVLFEKEESFKGSGTVGQVSVFTGSDGALCGYGFSVGETYLVYARETRSELWTGLCDRTRSFENAGSDITELRTLPQPIRLSVSHLDRGIQIVIEGAKPRTSYVLEGSSDFLTWSAVAQLVPENGRFVVPEVLDASESSQFFRLREAPESQGIYGITILLPGACLEDPERPGECLNQPFPGSFGYDVREYSKTPDLGRDNPVVASFQSRDSSDETAIPLDHIESLDSEVVTDALRDALQGVGMELSNLVKVVTRNQGRAWIVVDEAIQEVYYLEHAAETIRVLRTGTFRVSLPVGEYCVWSFFGCERQLDVVPGQWEFHILQVPLP